MLPDTPLHKGETKNIKTAIHDIKMNFGKILEVLKSILHDKLDHAGNFSKIGKKPKLPIQRP